jgi:hypothetical protein
MDNLNKYLDKYLKQAENKPPRHWKADITNQIIELVGLNRKYSKLSTEKQFKNTYVFWLSMIARSGKSWGDMMYILKEASRLDSKYNKAGFICNKLKGKAIKTLKLI